MDPVGQRSTLVSRSRWADTKGGSSVTHRRAVMAAWALMAVMNLSAGAVIASWPERHTDLDTMQRWGKTWLLGASNVYITDWNPPDYPPHAIVALSPLGILSPVVA